MWNPPATFKVQSSLLLVDPTKARESVSHSPAHYGNSPNCEEVFQPTNQPASQPASGEESGRARERAEQAEAMKAVFAGNAQPGAVGAARRLLASGLAIVTVNSPATRHALQEAGIAHQDVRGRKTSFCSLGADIQQLTFWEKDTWHTTVK